MDVLDAIELYTRKWVLFLLGKFYFDKDEKEFAKREKQSQPSWLGTCAGGVVSPRAPSSPRWAGGGRDGASRGQAT